MDQPRHVKDLVSLVPFVVAGALSFLNPANVAAAQADQRADTPAVTGAEMNERERKFSESMANVVLTGRFTTDGQNGTPEPERYHIVSATKLAGDNWVIVARISYGKRDVQPPPVPIPVKVRWAGDTPVLSLTDLTIPGFGTFTSRVLFYENRYAGTWQHGDKGGNLFGTISKADEDDEAANGSSER